MCVGGTESPSSLGTAVNLFKGPRKRREADEQMNVCIVPIEPCGMVGEDMGGGGLKEGGEERGRCLCMLPNLVNGCEASSGETNAFWSDGCCFFFYPATPSYSISPRSRWVQSPLPLCEWGEVGTHMGTLE